MTLINKKTILAAAIAVLMSTAAHANDMINNEAQGTIRGNVNQTSNYFAPDSRAVLAVGSIQADRALNNKATGRVEGRILQQGERDVIRVGAINAKTAYDNQARGVVKGAITQEAADWGSASPAAQASLIEVGSITAKSSAAGSSMAFNNGVALGNRANGLVDGAIRQDAGDKLRVGSIGPQ